MNNAKSKIKKIIVLVLCLAVVTGSVGVLAYNAGSNSNKNKETSSNEDTDSKSAFTDNSSESKISKDETVYVLAKADGSVKKVIVSDWIKNGLNKDKITDQTNLEDVTNVKGNEKYTMNSDNMRVWDANGNDIYYQGNIDKEIPVDVAISYKLNGETVTADELAGKSGEVTIRFDYANKQYEYVDINGKKEKIYVPYVMLSGMVLDNASFSNIKISNGKLINDGDRTYVVGFAMPGMEDNLAIDSADVNIPDYVEITADAKDFELTTTLSLATNEMFNDVDTDKFDSVDDLTNSLDDLTDAMNQLIDGSSKLYSGTSTLLSKCGQLIEGVDALAQGAEKLKNGTNDLSDGSNTLNNGLKDLSNGLSQLVSNNSDLTGAAKTVFETLLSTADTQISASGLDVKKLTISNYDDVLNNTIASLDETKIYNYAYATALKKVTETVKAQETYIKGQVTAAVQQQVLVKVLEKLGYTYEQYQQAVAAKLITQEVQSQITAAVEAQMKTTDINNTIDKTTQDKIQELIDENMKSDDVVSQINDAVKQAKDGATSLKSLKEQLDSYNEFYTGLKTYTNGVSSAYTGSQKLMNGAGLLTDGTSTLSDGAIQLFNGLSTMQSKGGQLVDGVSQLNDGAMQLSNGIKKFNEQGVQKLVDAVNGDLGDVFTRIKATIDVSKNYKSFAGIPEGMDGNVRFIYRTDSIEK